MRPRRGLQLLPFVAPLLLALAASGCFWLAAGQIGYEGYQYSQKKGEVYAAFHPKPQHQAVATPTPDIE
jgi:hypothetical protein